MHFAIDMDDVTVNFFPNVLDCFEREFGERPVYDGTPWGEDAIAFTKHPKLLAAGYTSWWDWLRERDWLWGIAPAVPGAIGGITTLRSRGHYVEALTSKPRWAEPQVWRWLGKWRPPFQRVTIIDAAQGQKKTAASTADVMVDDKLATCVEFVKDGRLAIWFNLGPHGLTVREGLYEANSWDDVLRIAEEIDDYIAD